MGNSGDESRLTYIGEANQTYISDYLKFENNFKFSCISARFCVFGSLHGARCKVLVTKTTCATGQNGIFLTVTRHVLNNFARLCISNNSTFRYLEDQVFTLLTMAILLATFFTVLCSELVFVTVICKSVDTLIYNEDYISALAAVTSIRTTVRYEFFPAEGYVSVATFSGDNPDFRSISKRIRPIFLLKFF